VCIGRTLLAREQQRMRSEYEQRLRDLESERLTAEHDKAQARQPPSHAGHCGSLSPAMVTNREPVCRST